MSDSLSPAPARQADEQRAGFARTRKARNKAEELGKTRPGVTLVKFTL